MPVTSANGPNPMKIGTLLTAAIVSLSAVGGGLAIYVATSKYQTMEKVSMAQSRLEVVRAVGDIPRYMNSERGFATNILYGPAAVDPAIRKELNEKVRKNTEWRTRQDERGAQEPVGQQPRRRRGDRHRHRRSEREVQRAARCHGQGDRRPGRSAQGRRQEARRRQCRIQRRGHQTARRAGAPHGATRRRCLPAGDLRQHRLEFARRRRLQFQPPQEPRRRQSRRHRSGKDGVFALAGPCRPDPDVADGIARQPGNARQRGGCAGQDERDLRHAFRQGTEARQGRRGFRQIRT